MIGKPLPFGKGFLGLVRYSAYGHAGEELDRVEWVESRNLPTEDPETAARLMAAYARQSVRTQRPVYHLVISADPGDPVDRASMSRVADTVLRELGLSEHQVLIIAHNDTAHPHMHLVVNRVHPETHRAWENGWDWPKIEKALSAEEEALGWRIVPRKRRHEPALVRGDAAFLRTVQERGGAVLGRAASWAELEEGLAAVGLHVRVKGGGLSINDGRQEVKASEVAPAFSRKYMEARLGKLSAHRAERVREAETGTHLSGVHAAPAVPVPEPNREPEPEPLAPPAPAPTQLPAPEPQPVREPAPPVARVQPPTPEPQPVRASASPVAPVQPPAPEPQPVHEPAPPVARVQPPAREPVRPAAPPPPEKAAPPAPRPEPPEPAPASQASEELTWVLAREGERLQLRHEAELLQHGAGLIQEARAATNRAKDRSAREQASHGAADKLAHLEAAEGRAVADLSALRDKLKPIYTKFAAAGVAMDRYEREHGMEKLRDKLNDRPEEFGALVRQEWAFGMVWTTNKAAKRAKHIADVVEKALRSHRARPSEEELTAAKAHKEAARAALVQTAGAGRDLPAAATLEHRAADAFVPLIRRGRSVAWLSQQLARLLPPEDHEAAAIAQDVLRIAERSIARDRDRSIRRSGPEL